MIVDAQTFLDVLGRGAKRDENPGMDRWNNELSWLFNAPPSEIRIKLNDQIHKELLQQGGAGLIAQQGAFIDAYRQSGKIVVDRGAVPFFASGRIAVYQQVHAALAATGNLGKGDLPIAADGITNRLRIISHDKRFIDGMEKALRNGAVKAVLKAWGLPADRDRIFIQPTRSAL
ncbi:hypothetical protein [Roseococcus sp.]|uniref:hypothetical protein n=1 Tax=Roseococcus sp. TaxID=2109646 RepID=UPI003BA9299A